MHPFLFQIGHFRVPAYGFFSLLALGVAVLLVRRFAKIDGLDPGKAADAVVLTIAVGYFGARALELAVGWRRYFATPGGLKLMLFSTGIFLGGVIVAVPFGWYWFRRVGIPYGKGLDLLAIAGAVAEAVGRWGCFCSGCCWGTPTDLPWAVTFPEIAQRLHTGLPGVPIHPTQLYLSLAGWAILGVLAFLYPRKRFDGQILAAFLVLYSVARFFLEFLRGDEDRGRVFGTVSTSQALCLVLVVLAAWAYVRGMRRAAA
ncbi:MAG TPA: prolipoprotein diacylglyceryl transferase family protein [Candidatus Polarisedimenticolaceae bacterium]|nr:prolipoprotein diacylglyceryl transferase family protein [Candidatus Polarisedimenticolaceae bacterium]